MAAQEKFEGKYHSEDLEKDVELTWQRIMRCGNGPIVLEDIIEGGREDAVTVVVSLLFLARAGKIALWQDDLPYGQVFLEIRLPWDIGTIEDKTAPLVPTPDKSAVI
jgi:segregation and condensation protein A